jgi:hypothetical protein
MHVQINGVGAEVVQRKADSAWLATLADGRLMQLGPEVAEAWLEGFAMLPATWTDGPAAMEGGGRPTPRGGAEIVSVEDVPAAADGDADRPFETSARTTINLRRAGGQPVVIRILRGFEPLEVDVPIETLEEQKARLRGQGLQSPGRLQWITNLETAAVKARASVATIEAQLETARARLAAAEAALAAAKGR